MKKVNGAFRLMCVVLAFVLMLSACGTGKVNNAADDPGSFGSTAENTVPKDDAAGGAEGNAANDTAPDAAVPDAKDDAPSGQSQADQMPSGQDTAGDPVSGQTDSPDQPSDAPGGKEDVSTGQTDSHDQPSDAPESKENTSTGQTDSPGQPAEGNANTDAPAGGNANTDAPAGGTSEIYISSIQYTSSLDLGVGSSAAVELSAEPENTTEKIAVVWSSTGSSVFSMGAIGRGSYYGESSSAVVTGLAGGKGTVVAEVTVYDSTGIIDGTATLVCYVSVEGADVQSKNVPLTGVSISDTSVSLEVKGGKRLSASPVPADTTDDTNVSWSSSNSAVAAVDQSGYVTAISEGSAVITASIGGKSASCSVTVTGFTDNGSYKDASDAYSAINSFRTGTENQWYWNEDNTTKTETPGLAGLSVDASLEDTAKLRAKEAWIQYYVNGVATHNRPDGSNCFTAYPSGLSAMGENLAWGYGSGSSVVSGWAETSENYAGQGHRRNMLSSNFTKVGIACYAKDGKTCWAMCLGR